jgi:hypothetical protein
MRINRKKIINKAWWLMGLMGICLHTNVAVVAQTCDPSVPATAPASRFNDNGDGTVTDRKTGLMWKQCMEGKTGHGCGDGSAEVLNWQEALQRAESSDFAGYQDWRLPNIKELNSIVERKCYNPAINLTIFPNTPSSAKNEKIAFWTGTPSTSNSKTWVVDFKDHLHRHSYSSDKTGRIYSSYYARLVRDTQH